MTRRKYTAGEIKEVIAVIEAGANTSFLDHLSKIKSDRDKEVARFIFEGTMAAYRDCLYEALGL